MTSFKKMSLKEYQDLVKNKNRIYDLTQNFTSPEILNRYRNEDDIDMKIKNIEEEKVKNEQLSNIFDKNLNKYFHKIEDKEKNTDVIEENTDIIEDEEYTFHNNQEIMKSFDNVFKKYNIIYKPYKKSDHIKIKYLLDKTESNENIPKKVFYKFDSELRRLRKLTYKLPITYIDEVVNINNDRVLEGEGVNNIKIDQNALNKNILKIRYINNRRLNNKLLNQDYKISNNMKNSLKFNKNIHKLSQNEMKIYHEIQKYLNKSNDLNLLIGSYLSGNKSKQLFNKINKLVYNKYKNNLITEKEYKSLLNKINIGK